MRAAKFAEASLLEPKVARRIPPNRTEDRKRESNENEELLAQRDEKSDAVGRNPSLRQACVDRLWAEREINGKRENIRDHREHLATGRMHVDRQVLRTSARPAGQ